MTGTPIPMDTRSAAYLSLSHMSPARLERALRTLSACNRSLLRAQDEAQLAHEACNNIVRVGGYRACSVAFLSDPTHTELDRVASAGETHEEVGAGLQNACIAAIQSVVGQLVRDDGPESPVAEGATVRTGLAPTSCLVLPLAVDGVVLGVLDVVATDPAGFDAAELGLLRELADDLAFGISSLRGRERLEEAERGRAQAEHQYRLIVNSTPDFVYSLDLEGRHTAANRAMCKALRLPVEQVVGKTHLELGYPVEQVAEWRELHQRVLDTGDGVVAETTTPMPDGCEHTYKLTLRPLRDDAGQIIGIMGMRRDVTEQRRAQREKTRLEAELQQVQRLESVGRLAGGVAHDFNNLLTAILGCAQIAELSLPSEDRVRVQLQRIIHAANRASELTRQLLGFSRRQIVDARVVVINQLVHDTVGLLERTIGEDIELVCLLEEAAWTTRIDPVQLQQVLVNLVVNARDAMPSGGKLTIETSNYVCDAEQAASHAEMVPGEYVMLAVSDDGVGMPPEVQQHIFEPFFTTKEKGRGTGLGLAMCYGIVRQAHGFIWLYSEPGKGTTFKIYLPRCTEGESVQPVTPKRRPLPMGQGSVLLVEDDADVREVTTQILERGGYRVIVAETPSEALAKPERLTADLLLTDIVMPGMDGHKLAAIISEENEDLVVLYMSGYTDNAIVHNGVLERGTAFLQKPFTAERLLLKVAEVLGDPTEDPKAK